MKDKFYAEIHRRLSEVDQEKATLDPHNTLMRIAEDEARKHPLSFVGHMVKEIVKVFRRDH